MTENEIAQLIKSNDSDRLNLFLTNILEKAKNIDKQLNLTSLAMLILILIYYLGELNLESELQLGPLKFNDLNTLLYILPLTLSFFILRFVILSSHKAELKKLIKVFAHDYFAFDNSKVDMVFTDDFTRLILPLSLHDEIGKFNLKTKTGCFSIILIIPVLAISLAPYYFVITWTYPHVIEFSSINIYDKILTISTVWIFFVSIFYLIKTMIIGVKEGA